jgi:hypothetical protein
MFEDNNLFTLSIFYISKITTLAEFKRKIILIKIEYLDYLRDPLTNQPS